MVELMVVVGLLAGVALFMAQIGDQASRTSKTANVNLALTNYFSFLYGQLSSTQNCSLNFAGYNPTRDQGEFNSTGGIGADTDFPTDSFQRNAFNVTNGADNIPLRNPDWVTRANELGLPGPQAGGFPGNRLWVTGAPGAIPRVALEVGQRVGNDFTITGIRTERVDAGEFSLIISYQKAGNTFGGQDGERRFAFGYSFEGATGTPTEIITSCRTNEQGMIQAAVDQAVEDICNDMNGIVMPDGGCEPMNPSDFPCNPGDIVTGFISDVGQGSFSPTCVPLENFIDLSNGPNNCASGYRLRWQSNQIKIDCNL